jgi:hypothetical protein
MGVLFSNARPLTSLNGQCATEATLDIEFLKKQLPDAAAAYVSFSPRFIRGPTRLGQITFELEGPMYVHITAETSCTLRYPTHGRSLATGLSFSNNPATVAADSVRQVRFQRRGAVESIQTSLGVRLEEGTYTVYWHVLPNSTRGIDAVTSSGTIMVEAFTHKIGGTLSRANVKDDRETDNLDDGRDR